MGVESQEGGISALDIADLPPLLRKIMRQMLREYELTYGELCEWADALPEAERISRKELDNALQELSTQFWLIKRGDGEKVRYQTNLRRKAPSTLAAGIWGVLDAKIKKNAESGNSSQT